MEVDGSTIYWWLEQNQNARDRLQNPKPIHLKLALLKLRQFYEKHKPSYLWAHATFDPVLVAEAYRLIGQSTPWGRRDPRDLRTLEWLAGNPPHLIPKNEDLRHDALYDAQVQAVRINQLLVKAGKK